MNAALFRSSLNEREEQVMSDTDDGNKVAVIVKMDASRFWFMPPSDAYLALMADIREAEQSPEYRALVDEVRKWMPVAAGGMGMEPSAPAPGTAPAPDACKPAPVDQLMRDPERVEMDRAVGNAISRPQAMRVGVFTVR
jgi:hypothetical protein